MATGGVLIRFTFLLPLAADKCTLTTGSPLTALARAASSPSLLLWPTASLLQPSKIADTNPPGLPGWRNGEARGEERANFPNF